MRPFLRWGNAAARCLLNTLSAHRITEELADSKVLLKGAYSEVDQPVVGSIGKRTPDHWSERVSVAAVLSCPSDCGQRSGKLWAGWPRPCGGSSLDQPPTRAHTPAARASRGARRCHRGQPGSTALSLPHFTEKSARPALRCRGIGGALIERRSRISLPRIH
jgi:hypothetical protein